MALKLILASVVGLALLLFPEPGTSAAGLGILTGTFAMGSGMV